MNFFITGKPGIGKTTLVRNIVAQTNLQWAGFYTQEIRENENRVGFEIIGLNGETGILAHINHHSKFRVGKYKVSLYDLETVGVAAIEQALMERRPILIDEIGKMELISDKFKTVVKRALTATQVVLGTITMADLSFVNQIKRRTDVIVAELTADNRNILQTMILDFLQEQGIKYV